jgi:membrane-bound lytic murein transglycosylase D
MTNRAWLPVAVIGVAITATACASAPKAQSPTLPPAIEAAPPPPAAPQDPITILIASSQTHFEAGEREMKMGHLERARVEFDRAVNVLLESPYGARTEPRLREHFDRLIDRINAYEVIALAQGDGFAETMSEPASIDELLKIATFPKPEVGAATEETVKADLAATAHDVPIPQNSKVLSYVELMQGRLREYIQESLTRGTKYLPMIQNVFRAEGLPLDLAYIPIIESGFKTNALSRASAKGPWQFMKLTAKEQGLKYDWYIDERSDPEKATLAAARYLKSLHKLFDGDWHLVLAAYNGGMGRVQRAMRRAGTDDFWKISRSSRYLPRETREYVPLILAAIIVARNPAQYGFDITPEQPVAYEKVAVPRAVDLRRVAEWTGTTIDEIQSLNPELRRWTTPVKGEYAVKVPVGTAERLRSELNEAASSEFGSFNWHTVRRGETLTSKVRPGQELIVPRAPATLLAARSERTAPSEVASRAIGGASSVASTDSHPGTPLTYRVKRGDTLSSIARLYNTSVARIKALNRLRGNTIVPGDRLTIRTR